jgi:predicted murein hydrolase (TIGR00659 family)
LIAYLSAYWLYKRFEFNPILNPVVVAVGLMVTLLWLTDTKYQDYFEGAQFVHFLLGPATVALAIPLYSQLSKLRAIWWQVALSIVVGLSIASLSAMWIAWLLGASSETVLTLAPKSVTAPVAMGISEKIGGLPSLTAVLVVLTGVLGAVFGTKIFSLLRITDDSVRGIAMGVTSHGIGTARAFQVSERMGAFSGLAMALSALATALLLPWLVALTTG